MLRASILYTLSIIRDKLVFFWAILFPLVLMIFFGYVFSKGPGLSGIVYMNYPGNDSLEKLISRSLVTAGFKVVKVDNGISNITDFLKYKLIIHPGKRIAYISINKYNGRWNITIYSDDDETAGILSNTLSATIGSLYYSNRIAIKTQAVSAVPGDVIAYMIMAMLIALSGCMNTAAVITGLFESKLNKIIWLSSRKKMAMFLLSFIPASLVTLFSLFATSIIANALYKIDVMKVLGSGAFWAAFIINYIFAYSISIIITGISLLAAPLYSTASLQQSAVTAFLLIAFVSGYFYPYEMLPRGIKIISHVIPSFYTLSVTKLAILYGATTGSLALLLIKAFIITFFLFILGIKIFKPVREL